MRKTLAVLLFTVTIVLGGCGTSTSARSSGNSGTGNSGAGNTGAAFSGNSDTCPSNGLTGFGATQKVWNECQGADLRGCSEDSCAGPLTTVGGVEETFIEVEFTGGRVSGYTQTLPGPMDIAQAETAALQLFPSGADEVARGIAASSDGETCRWVNYQSATIATVGITLKDGDFSLEFADADNTNGNWTYEPNDINQVLAINIWYIPGNGC